MTKKNVDQKKTLDWRGQYHFLLLMKKNKLLRLSRQFWDTHFQSLLRLIQFYLFSPKAREERSQLIKKERSVWLIKLAKPLYLFHRWCFSLPFGWGVFVVPPSALKYAIGVLNVISPFTFDIHEATLSACPHLHVSQSTLCSQHCSLLVRSTPNILDFISSKQIYFGFVWPNDVLPVLIRPLFIFFGKSLILQICAIFVSNDFLLGRHP